MEYQQPHVITNRALESRMALRAYPAIERALTERIGDLPEDDFCREDIEYLQLGAGYAHMLHASDMALDPAQYGSEYTATVLEGFFAMRPRNRYLYDHEVREHHKQICEAVLSPAVEFPESVNPYEVSAAVMFVEGYSLVAAAHHRPPTAP